MKQLPFLIFVVVVCGLAVYVFPGVLERVVSPDTGTPLTDDSSAARLMNAEYGIALPYRDGAEGYTLVLPVDTPEGSLLFTASLIATREYEAVYASEELREGPPAITVSVYRDPTSRTAEERMPPLHSYLAV